MNTAFHTFKRNGKQFLLIPQGPNCMICDSEGNNYGSYMELKSFDHMAEREGGYDKLKLGKVAVQFQFIN